MTKETLPPRKRNEQPHDRLKAWHACHELSIATYQATIIWSLEDDDFLGEEVRKSAHAATVALMIGASAEDPEELLRQSAEACGKLARVSSGLLLARDVDLIDQREYGQLEALRDHAARLTRGLRASLQRKSTGESPRKTRGK